VHARAGRTGGGHGGIGLRNEQPAKPERNRAVDGFTTFVFATLSHRLHNGEHKSISIDAGHSDVIIARREVALGIPIQRKYGRQQVRWTNSDASHPHSYTSLSL